MNVLIIGNAEDRNRFNQRFPNHNIQLYNQESEAELADLIVVFDTNEVAGHHPIFQTNTPVLINCNFQSLASFFKGKKASNTFIAGFCSLPTFFERDILELSVLQEKTDVAEFMMQLSTEIELVNDQVGLVTPRIIAMIINEAFYTVEDGTALREDIDIAMKLGTNYPYGPFEWCTMIGIKNIYNLINSVFIETGDNRYRPCDTLKKEAEISF